MAVRLSSRYSSYPVSYTHLTQSLGQKSAAVVIADRWYRQGDTVSAYSLSFIPIEVIAGQGLDLNREQELKTFLETAVYSGEYGSACALTYTTTGNFTAVKRCV